MLSGLRAVTFTAVGPGARCTRILADYGFEVTHVSPPDQGAAPGRTNARTRGSEADQLIVDLKQPGRSALGRRLCAPGSTSSSRGFRPGVADRLGIGYDAVRELNPGTVYCSISSYGKHGRYAGRDGHELNFLALAGYLSGEPGSDQPHPSRRVVADDAAGMTAATAILAALLRRNAQGVGAHLDIAILDGVVRMMQPYLEPHRVGDQLDESVYPELRAEIARAFTTRTQADWFDRLGAVTCLTPVNSFEAACADPHIGARYVTLDDESGRPRQRLNPSRSHTHPPTADGSVSS